VSSTGASSSRQRAEARRLIQRGDLDRAQTLLHDLLRANHGDAPSWHLLGTIHYRKGERASAVEAFRRELRLADDDPVAYYSLAIALPEDERDDAAALLKKALQLKPDFAPAKQRLAAIERVSLPPSPKPPTVPDSLSTPPPGPPVLTATAGPIRGQARTIQHRVEQDPWLARTSFIIWSFRVDRLDDQGNKLSPVPVEMRGRRIEGALVEGDWVEVPGKWRPGETLETKRIRNLSTGANVKARGDIGRGFQVAILVVFVLAFLAFATWVGYNMLKDEDLASVAAGGIPTGGQGQVNPPTQPEPSVTTDQPPTTTEEPPPPEPITAVIECSPTGTDGAEVMITVGDSVQWVNAADEPMELTSDPVPADFAPQSFEPGGGYQLAFTEPGSYKYACIFSSEDQTGLVTVSPA
jgi:plastocyanin